MPGLRPPGSLSAASVWIADELLARCREDAGRWAPRETGGMLLGFAGHERLDDFVVTDLVPAGPKAKHRRRRFVPDGAWQQRRLEDIYAASGNVTTYLGDWHSHPGGFATPSWRDERTAQKVAAAPESRIERPLTLIFAAGRAGAWELAAFRLEHGDLRRARLVVGL